MTSVHSMQAASNVSYLSSLSPFPQTQTLIFLSCVRLDLSIILGAYIDFQLVMYFVYSGLTFNTLSAPALILCFVVCLNLLCVLVQ